MSDLVLHWSPLSPFVRKVMCLVHELGLTPRVSCVRTRVARQEPNLALMALNPLIRIPTLELADGTALYDSVVICEYLDSLVTDATLYPAAGPARWQALRWQALGDGLCDTLILWRHERDRPPEQRQEGMLRASALKVEASLALLERELEALDGAAFGIGHIAIGCALGYLAVRFADLSWQADWPGLAQWHAAFESRPASHATAPPSA